MSKPDYVLNPEPDWYELPESEEESDNESDDPDWTPSDWDESDDDF